MTDHLLPTNPPGGEIERPLFVVCASHGTYKSELNLKIIRMDAMPERDRWGEKLRQDQENWLPLPHAARLLSDLLGLMPTYVQAVEMKLAEDRENLNRFNDEFGFDVAKANRKAG